MASGRRKKRVRSANSSGALINPTRRAIKESSRRGAGPENRLTLEKHASLKFIYLVQDVSSFHVQHTWIGSSIPLSRQRLSPFPTLYRKYRVSFPRIIFNPSRLISSSIGSLVFGSLEKLGNHSSRFSKYIPSAFSLLCSLAILSLRNA